MHVIAFVTLRPEIVILTFDVELSDSASEMREILNILDERNITATFFVLGAFAETYPELVREISQTHEVACHSMTHPKLPLTSYEEKTLEIQKCKTLISNITKQEIHGFRAPYLMIDQETMNIAQEIHCNKNSHECYDSSLLDYNKFYPRPSLTELPISTNYLIPLQDYFYFYILHSPQTFFFVIKYCPSPSHLVINLHPHMILAHDDEFRSTLDYLRENDVRFYSASEFLKNNIE